MRLRKVRIQGFKTFADRTELEFGGDMVAVVGPNGCGKSNIVDAIAWGLGEANARQLRAQSGVEVIFNGSSRRKPLGLAEVTLCFENEDRALAIDADEVTITRRLTRSGDSEFQINRRTCRLRDIYDLLADSGLGRSGYAIVGQREIDAAMAASPEERRAWVDEAAGVQRYRAHRQESIRRLSAAADHLARIDDLIAEIEAQRAPLAAEAEIARRYKQTLASLRDIELGTMAREIFDAAKAFEEASRRGEEAMESARALRQRQDELDERVRVAGEQVSEVEAEMDVARGVQQAALTAMERAEAAIRLAEQRSAGLDELERALDDEESARTTAAEEARSERDAAVLVVESERANLARLEAHLSGVDKESGELAETLKKAEDELARLQEDAGVAMREQMDRSHRAVRLAQAEEELAGTRASLPQTAIALREAIAAEEAAERSLESLVSAREARRAALADARDAEVKTARELRGIAIEREALRSRALGLAATLEAHEGLAQGARAVLDAVRAGRLRGDYTPVAEAIEVSRELALPIETALAASSHDLIVPTEQDAKRAIEYLKAGRLGRATFQPVSLMRPARESDDLRDLLRDPHVIGLADRLVACRDEHRPVIESLLGRVVVVRDLEAALRIARTSGWRRLVTLDGELVHSGGAVTGGVGQRAGAGLVQRKAELREAEAEVARLTATAEKLEREAESQRRLAEESAAAVRALDEQVAAAEAERRDAHRWRAGLEQEHKQAERDAERLRREIADLKDHLARPVSQMPDLEPAQNARDEAMRRLADHGAATRQAHEARAEAMKRLAEAEERLLQAERRRERTERQGDRSVDRRDRIARERERVRIEIEAQRVALADAQGDRDRARIRLEEATERKRALLQASLDLAEESKELRGRSETIAAGARQAEIDRARADARRAAAAQRMLEEYGIAEEEALEMAPTMTPPPDASALVQRLRRELKAMGDVNLGAIEAYERLTQRWDELTAQRDDIEAGKRQVEEGIRELDRVTRDRFRETFAALQRSFADLFGRLFGGGEGALRLTDPDNLLETGVEIDVTIPGKLRQRLELLSGGERALSACAFLFALLQVRPSSLVVLDEVDAPLDGRNVERFIQLLKEFASSTQFILITHNPTTIEAMPIWFGVTMQEPGVSAVVPYRAATAVLA
jgi:chromosome segregation protein